MSASRLPGKPLLKINGISIIQHVYNKAKATKLGKVYVATEDIINLDKNVRKLNSKIGTLCTDIKDKKIFSNSNIVKVSVNETFQKNNYSPALTFFRDAEDFDEKITYHHIGIYQYEISTLKKFINLKQTENEKKFRLEQLRALDNGIQIDVMYTRNSPIGVDTMDDFMEIKKIMEYKKD